MMPAAELSLPAFEFLRAVRRPATRRRRYRRALGRLAIAGVLLAVSLHGSRVALGYPREVEPAHIYRAAQMSPAELRDFIARKNIRTVVNLRGHCPDFDWYRDECAVTYETGISQEDVTLSAIRLPAAGEIHRLIEVLDQCRQPILLHCRQGVDRTGLAATACRLLTPGVSFAAATRHLSLEYGYVPYNGTENMRRFTELYRAWLEGQGVVHSPELFRHWATREYCPGRCRADLHIVDPGPWTPGQARIVTLRASNTSIEPWTFRPGTNQGVHARYRIVNARGQVVMNDNAGRFDAVVQPGEFIDLAIGVVPLTPGRYHLSVDMIDENQNAFSQFGVAPAVLEFEVPAH